MGYFLEKALKEVTELFLKERIAIIHAMILGVLSEITANWVKEIKRNNTNLIEIIQHG